MATRQATTTSETIEIRPIKTMSIALAILGVRPLILNRLAEKARQELLLPRGGRKTQADRAASLKHDPLSEFRASPYVLADDDEPTYIGHMSSAFKGAMMSAALDLPGAKKAQIGRLVYVEGDLVPIYGVPEMFMAITRSADIGRTPDVRTRAIVPRWAANVVVTFATPLLNERSVVNLLAAAGQICGVGDWRPEKGRGTYGQFVLADPDDERFRRVVENGGRAVQIAAMADPVAYDHETSELFGWFGKELVARGKSAA